MTEAEKREASRQFYQKWVNKGREDEDDRSYWLDILTRIMGIEDATDHIDFQKKVIVDGNTKRIDAYLPDTRVIIEQKTLGISLDKKGHQSGGIELTPYEQAKRYNDNLPFDEKARWIVTSNFAEIWIYDMNMRVPEPTKLEIKDLQDKFSMLDFLINQEQKKISQEEIVSKEAGDIVGEIYDALKKQYIDPNSERSLKSLNMLCVRLVFCLYAEDAGIFGKHTMFHDYMEKFDVKDMRKALIELFKILDTKPEDRDPYDTSELSEFPYVNGGLFADENIEIPNFTEEIKTTLLTRASDNFNWSMISPTIFGAVFESTLNPETRHSNGMHYTSIENIHKVIDPLFLNELTEELNSIKSIQIVKDRNKRLLAYQNKLASLKWLDPACGSGNFLTETYISVRRLENEVINTIKGGQMSFVISEEASPIKVSINQFYGIEINDFAVTVAKTALWIAESQMMKETEDILLMHLDFLPLKTNAYIVEGNALSIAWEDIISQSELTYIMGNPPFIGSSKKEVQNQQKEDKIAVFGDKKAGKLDYVACWYKKAAEYIKNTAIKCAFVSTNSITQGEQVRPLWEDLLTDGIIINFAYRTFQWDSEAHIKAHVHCVIIGFSRKDNNNKFIVEEGVKKAATHINGYLVDFEDFYIESRGKAPANLPKLTQGNKPWDDGGLIVSAEERESLLSKYPHLDKYIKPYVGAREFINNIKRYCLWLVDAEPSEYANIEEIRERLNTVKNIRLASPTVAVQKQAETPSIFSQIRQPDGNYILIPETSSSNRRYIPIGFMDKDTIVSNSVMTANTSSLYIFGVLESNVHMAWARTLCGRMKSDYRYSPSLYNNFPWPDVSDDQKAKIEQTAQAILDARAKYPNSSLDELYDRTIGMPKPLSDAHEENNRAVMKAYGFNIKGMSEADCVVQLMKMYQQMTK